MNVLELICDEVVRELEEVIPAADRDQGRCIQATRVGIETLRYFGLTGKPLMTLMLTGNAAWVAWMNNGSPDPMPDEVWAVGIDPDDTRPGFSGHLVISIDGHLLDLDAGFYTRPHRGIHVPPTVLAPLLSKAETDRTGWFAGLDLEEGGAILYGQHHTPPDFRKTNAWKATGKWAGPVIRRVREKLNWARESDDVARTVALSNLRHHGRLT